MPNLNLKNIPDNLYEQLKQSATANHRSMNSELIVCLEKIFMPQKLSAQESIEIAKILRKKVKTTKISIKEITEAKRTGRQ